MNAKRMIPKVGAIEDDGIPSVVVPQLARLEAERVAERVAEEKRQAEERAREAERLAALRATAGAD